MGGLICTPRPGSTVAQVPALVAALARWHAATRARAAATTAPPPERVLLDATTASEYRGTGQVPH